MRTSSKVMWMLSVVMIGATASAQVGRNLRESPVGSAPQNRMERQTQPIQGEYFALFQSVEMGLQAGNAGMVSRHFSPQVYISVPNGERGYYSSSQAHYILQQYLGGRPIQSLRLQPGGTSEPTPFASGQGRLEARGTVQVYVALTKIGNQWMVSQLTIY